MFRKWQKVSDAHPIFHKGEEKGWNAFLAVLISFPKTVG